MKSFIIKLLLFFLPVEVAVGIYFIKDPFMVLYHHDSYYKKDQVQHIILNRDYVNTEFLLATYDKRRYDSYIFGSSRSINYRAADWTKYIGPASCFHYDASDETLYGIERKIQLLKERNMKVKNALLIMDYYLLRGTENSQGHLFVKHPLLSGENRIRSQVDFFAAYLNKDFFPAYFDFLMAGHTKFYMLDKGLLCDIPTHYDVATNEVSYPVYDSEIRNVPDVYYKGRMHLFTRFHRDTVQRYAVRAIGAQQKQLLQNIKQVFTEDNTNYTIIISPLYDQLKLNDSDAYYLRELFGKEHVFDFSGINTMTQDYHNYYDDYHYTPAIATKVLDRVYAGK